MLRAAGSIALASLLLATQPSASELKETIPGEQRLVDLYQRYRDSIVKVKVATKSVDQNGVEQVALTVQSGFYIDNNGTVLTNAVPVQEGPRIRIEKDGVQLLAVPIASDPRSNIALVQVAKPPANISYIELLAPQSNPPIGSLVYAITSPLDLAPTPKLGLITGRESRFSDIIFPFTYTRISIPSGPAEGGSPVFDSEGALLGISVASLPDVDSSYIVPAKQLLKIVKNLKEKTGKIHPVVQARITEKVDPTTFTRSVFVNELTPQSAAERSGLQEGDQILSIQGQPLTSINDWRDALFFCEADSFASLTIRRGDDEKEITLLLESE